jgi:hypothetical protein
MKYLIVFLLSIQFCELKAQKNESNNPEIYRIILNPIINSNDLSSDAKGMLSNQMNTILTNNGMSGNSINPRFVFTNKITLLNKEVITGAIKLIAIKIIVSFYIGDAIDNRLYSNISFTLKGVGESEIKAQLNALKNLKTNSSDLTLFFKEGREKIINYYANNCESILLEASNLELQHNFREAIYLLNSVPNACLECHNKCISLSSKIYQNMIDFDCESKLKQIKSIWVINQNSLSEIFQIVSSINIESKCMNEVDSLILIFQNKVALDKKNAEAEEIRRYNEKIQVEKISKEREYDLEQKRIQAYKEISIEYYKNQPTRYTYNIIW